MAKKVAGDAYNNKQTRVKKYKAKRRKIKVVPVLLLLLILFLIIGTIRSLKITNIYISGNSFYKDQDIIELAKVDNYPLVISNFPWIVKRRLEKNKLILSASVSLRGFTKLKIKVKENQPLFYNSTTSKTILFDGNEIDGYYDCATLINYVPDTVYPNFVKSVQKINKEVLERISEIKYDPNDVDTERFLFMMDDGNYVYITLSKMENINNYINIIKNFNSKKGILYLDSGEYFKILDN